VATPPPYETMVAPSCSLFEQAHTLLQHIVYICVHVHIYIYIYTHTYSKGGGGIPSIFKKGKWYTTPSLVESSGDSFMLFIGAIVYLVI